MRLLMRRYTPGAGFIRVAEVADAEGIGLVFPCREAVAGASLEGGELGVVQGHAGRRFSMGRAVAGLALYAPLVAAAVYELAEQGRGGGVGGAPYDAGGMAGEGRSCASA